MSKARTVNRTAKFTFIIILLSFSVVFLQAKPGDKSGDTKADAGKSGTKDDKSAKDNKKSAKTKTDKTDPDKEKSDPKNDKPATENPDASENSLAEPKPQYNTLPLGEDGKPVPLKMGDAVKMVVENNADLRIQQLELLKSDTELKKDESKYSPILGLKYQGVKKIDKPSGATTFSGTKTYNDVVAASVQKLFSSGTYFEVEVSDTRFDSNAGEGIQFQGTLLEQIASPPLHTGALKLVLRQELVKNAFGYSQRRLNQIARNNSVIQRETLILTFSNLIVKTMVDYWSLAIAEENVKTAEILLKNTRNIRAITIRKRRLGLAESFEVNQWNALVAQTESQLDNAKLQRDQTRRTILRTLNLDPSLELSGATELEEALPEDLDPEKDLKWALDTRPDIKNLKLQMENARLALELARNNQLPSVSLGGTFSHRDQGRKGSTAFREVPSGKYPEYAVEFKVEYPLWDEGIKVDARNARVSLRQIKIRDEQLRRQIKDEIDTGLQSVKTAHESLKKAISAEKQTRAYYYGLLKRYRQGRFTAVAIKNALDALAQARQALMQARINYNITLVRYDLTRNNIFKRFSINIDEQLDKIKEH